MRWLGGHLGDRVSALVDGQLDADTAERAWSHVLGCDSCRDALERETWVKQRLSGLGCSEPPTALTEDIGRLPRLDHATGRLAAAWATVAELERRQRLRRAALVAAGAGSVSAAVIGLGAVSGNFDLDEPGPTGAVVGRSTPTPPLEPAAHPTALPSARTSERPNERPSERPSARHSSRAGEGPSARHALRSAAVPTAAPFLPVAGPAG